MGPKRPGETLKGRHIVHLVSERLAIPAEGEPDTTGREHMWRQKDESKALKMGGEALVLHIKRPSVVFPRQIFGSEWDERQTRPFVPPSRA